MFQYKVIKRLVAELQTAFPSHDVAWGFRNVSGFGSHPRITLLTAYQAEDPQLDSAFIPQLQVSVDVEAPLNMVSEQQLWEEYAPVIVRLLQTNQFTLLRMMPTLDDSTQDKTLTLHVTGTRPAA